MVTLSLSALEAMTQHAESGYPLEICGLLAGTIDGDDRIVVHAWPVRNSWEDDAELREQLVTAVTDDQASADRWASASAERRYLVAPGEIVACMKRARAEGLQLVGVYHTHPEHPAEPSTYARDPAMPTWSYLILSVRGGTVAELRSWIIEDDEADFTEERIERG